MAGAERGGDHGARAADAIFYRRLARHAGLRFVVLDPDAIDDPDVTEINPLAARLLTEELCRHFRMLPIAYRDGVVAVAFCDPFDKLASELVTALTASKVQSPSSPRRTMSSGRSRGSSARCGRRTSMISGRRRSSRRGSVICLSPTAL